MSYVLSLIAGLIFGVLYALVGIRSPAPPLIALIGLLGMVLGENGALLLKQNVVHRADRAASVGDGDSGGSS